MTITIAKLLFCSLVLFAFSFLSSCDNDENTSPAESSKYILATTTGSFPSETSFLQTLEDLDITTPIDNSAATEVNGPVAVMGSVGGNIFAGRYGAPAQLFRYKVNDDNFLAEDGIIQIDGASTFSGLLIVDENEAYCIPYGVDKVIKFNPTSFQKTGEVDLASLQKESYTMIKSGLVKRDNKLFIPIDYTSSSSPAMTSTFVAIANLADNSVKIIEDTRSKDNQANAFPTIALDESNNIYLQCKGAPGDLPGAVLRIKSGTETFDADYLFDLDAATSTTRVIGLTYLKNGKALTAAQTTATGNVYFDPVYSYYVVDLSSKTATRINGIPENIAYRSGKALLVDDNTALIPTQTTTENAFYTIDISSSDLTATKKFTTVDRIAHLIEIK